MMVFNGHCTHIKYLDQFVVRLYCYSVVFLLFEMDFCFTTQKVNVENLKRIIALIYIQRFVS